MSYSLLILVQMSETQEMEGKDSGSVDDGRDFLSFLKQLTSAPAQQAGLQI